MAAFQKAIDATDRTTSLSFTDSSQPIQIAVGDLSGVSISVSGTFTGSLAFEGSVSGTSWSAIDVYRLSDNTESATITTAGQYGINSTAFSQIKIVPTIESGTAVVELLAVKSNLLIAPAAGSGESTTIDLGNKIDTATMPTGGVGLLGWVSGAFKALGDIFQLLSDRFPALVSGKIPVDGTFWQATQPVSASSLPLPSGAATSGLQTTANTSLSNIDTKTPVLGQALATASVPVVLPAAQITTLTPPTSVGISGTLPAFTSTPTFNIGTAPAGLGYLSTATITRAANTTAYTANDVYGGVFELQNIGASGGFVFIDNLDIMFNISSLPVGMGAFSVYLFSSSPPSAITDNLPYSLSSGDRASAITKLGIDLTASLARGGGTVVAERIDLKREIKLATGSTSLWGYLVTLGSFTPAANSETATITVRSFAP